MHHSPIHNSVFFTHNMSKCFFLDLCNLELTVSQIKDLYLFQIRIYIRISKKWRDSHMYWPRHISFLLIYDIMTRDHDVQSGSQRSRPAKIWPARKPKTVTDRAAGRNPAPNHVPFRHFNFIWHLECPGMRASGHAITLLYGGTRTMDLVQRKSNSRVAFSNHILLGGMDNPSNLELNQS
jgi:hypothetical protein